MMPAMRILVSSTPGWGHVAPMLPVVDEREASVLRTAIERALTDRAMIGAAAEVRDEIGDAALPGRAADWVEALVQRP